MESEPNQTRPGPEPTPYDRKTLYRLLVILTILVLSIVFSIYSGKDIYIFGYIMVIVYTFGQFWQNRSWKELGIKHGFVKDFKQVWYYFGIDAFLFQILPPTFGIAFVFGLYPELLNHIIGRLSIDFGTLEGISTLGEILILLLILTLMEEVVFRVTIQERLSWFIGTPSAILFTSIIFGLVHSVGTTGSLPIISLDVIGVVIDGIFFGIIYAKTKNLTLTWATHYIADVVGLLALVFIFR